MFRRRKPKNVEPHPRFIELEVRTALDVLAHPDTGTNDDAVGRLVELGIATERAHKLVLLLPSAAAHVVMAGIDISAPKVFTVLSSLGSDPIELHFEAEPYYLEGLRIARDAYITGYREMLIPVGGRSAEWKGTEDARQAGYTAEQISAGNLKISYSGLEPESWDSNDRDQTT